MKLAITTLAAALCAGTLAAQTGPPEGEHRRGFHAEALQTQLNLSDEQLQTLREIHRDTREAMRPIREEMRTKFQELRQEFRAETPDGTRISQLRDGLETLKEEAQAKRAEYRTQAQNVLTAEQKATLAELEAALELHRAARQAQMLNLLEGPEMMPGRLGGPHGLRGHGRRGFHRGPLGPGPGPAN